MITILRCIKMNMLFPHHLGRGKKRETSREGTRKSYDGRLLRGKKKEKKIKVEHVRREEGEKRGRAEDSARGRDRRSDRQRGECVR